MRRPQRRVTSPRRGEGRGGDTFLLRIVVLVGGPGETGMKGMEGMEGMGEPGWNLGDGHAKSSL